MLSRELRHAPVEVAFQAEDPCAELAVEGQGVLRRPVHPVADPVRLLRDEAGAAGPERRARGPPRGQGRIRPPWPRNDPPPPRASPHPVGRKPGDPVSHRHVAAGPLHRAGGQPVRGLRRAVEEISPREVRARDGRLGRVEHPPGGTPAQDLPGALEPAGARVIADGADALRCGALRRGAAAAGRVVAVSRRDADRAVDSWLESGGLLRPPAGLPLAAHREAVDPPRLRMVGIVSEPALQLVVARTVLRRMQVALGLDMTHEEPATELPDFPVRGPPAALLLQLEDPPVLGRVPFANDPRESDAVGLPAALFRLHGRRQKTGARREETRESDPQDAAGTTFVSCHPVVPASTSLFLMAIRSFHASLFWAG